MISAAWLPLWVAQDEDIFDNAGLEVEIQTVQNLSTTIGALGRQLEISGATTIDIVKAAAGGLDVVGISGNTIETSANRQMRLVGRKGAGIQGIADLRGRTIGTPSINGAIHVATLLALKESGIDPKGIRFVEMMFPNMADQLTAEQVDAVETVEPFVSMLLAAGHQDLGDPMLNVGDPVTLTCWMAGGEWARNNEAAIASWRASLDEARAYIEANDGPARSILEKWTKLPSSIVDQIRLPSYSTALNAADVAAWIKATRDAGQIPGDRELDPATLVAG
ncbi:ABC transporter substrate-binding protein [Mesorhizobium camelthorni]|uniref:ABC transporter substrate-binding protein n=1 Tax=Allomesorhizobium camelthorni TaxID=475069 RepID=A0A6G4WGH4_9HYPH|nr:ABC transporter substrate-binding protein [Mesorhizobium camelthorni]